MKRLLIQVILVFLLLSACGIESRHDQVLSSLGRWDSKTFYTSGGFQDYTDFARYTFSEVSLENSPYFAPVSETDRDTLSAFLDNFEQWIGIIGNSDPRNEVVIHYDFDRSIIDTGDYFYICEDADYPEFGCYDVWIFDTQTCVLYYFHNNI